MSASDVVLPQLGETVEEALIIKWFKSPGQSVNRGETLLEAETDKITVEVPSLVSGELVEIVAEEGTTVSVGAVIARINEDGAKASPPQAAASQKAPPTPAAESSALTTASTSVAESTGSVTTPTVNRLRASPAARSTARKLGLDLTRLRGSGTGPLGRITKADVLAMSEQNQQAAAAPAPVAAPPTPGSAAGSAQAGPPPASYSEALPASGPAAGSAYQLTRIEQVSARLTARSFQEVPHFYVTLKVDVTETVRRLRALPDHMKVSINDALVKVTALVLELHPRLNATLQGDRIQLHSNVDIGVITATDDGVITSVVPGANRAGLTQIRSRVREVRARLASGQAQPSDVSGATFSISNMGMFGVDSFSAIILQPNVAILAVGALKEEVLVDAGRMYLGQTIALTVSADHRAIDGVAVANFLKDMQQLLSEPERWVGN